MSFLQFYWASLQEIPGWLRQQWERHHCYICGRFEWTGVGHHWPCERALLPPQPDPYRRDNW